MKEPSIYRAAFDDKARAALIDQLQNQQLFCLIGGGTAIVVGVIAGILAYCDIYNRSIPAYMILLLIVCVSKYLSLQSRIGILLSIKNSDLVGKQ